MLCYFEKLRVVHLFGRQYKKLKVPCVNILYIWLIVFTTTKAIPVWLFLKQKWFCVVFCPYNERQCGPMFLWPSILQNIFCKARKEVIQVRNDIRVRTDVSIPYPVWVSLKDEFYVNILAVPFYLMKANENHRCQVKKLGKCTIKKVIQWLEHYISGVMKP